MNYLDLTIKELHNELVKKNVTPLDLVNESIRRAKEDDTNAFEYIMENEAIEMARKLTVPEVDNLLWGIPFAIKDNFSTKGVVTTASSNILKGYTPVYDSTVYKKLLELNAIPIGKTTLDELAMGGSGLTGHLGATYNPYDKTKKRIIAGSSCGSASVTASCIVPFAIGSDTGDSVRRPASYAGLVGVKPTWGLVSRYGLFPFCPSMDTVGFFTRSVFDAGIVLNAISGYDSLDATSMNKTQDDYMVSPTNELKGRKIAVVKEIVESISDDVVKFNFQKTLQYMKSCGAEINYVSIEKDILKAVFPTYFVITCAEATSNNANLDGIKFGLSSKGNTYIEVMKNSRTEGFGEMIKRRFVFGSYSLNKENQDEVFLKAKKIRRVIVDALNLVLRSNDVIYTPSTPSIAPFIDEEFDRLSDEYLIAGNYLCASNFGGMPGISIPIGFDKSMPFGGHIMGKIFDDKLVLNIANALEQFTGFYNLSSKEVK